MGEEEGEEGGAEGKEAVQPSLQTDMTYGCLRAKWLQKVKHIRPMVIFCIRFNKS